jgi:hypothetical protein
VRPLDDPGFAACAREALAADFDPVPWDEASEWRRRVSAVVAESALDTNNPDHMRCAWTTEMCAMGWKWDREFSEAAKTHPGIVFGELTRGGTKHWCEVARRVRDVGRRLGVRMLGP